MSARRRRSRAITPAGAADALVLPGVGAFPKGMAICARTGWTRFLRERVAAGTPLLGICLGHAVAVRLSTELGGRRARPDPRGRSERSTADGLRSRTSAGMRSASSALGADRRPAGRGRAVLPRPLLRRRNRPTPETSSARPIRRAVRDDRQRAERLWRAVPPGEVLTRRPRVAAAFRRREGRGRVPPHDPATRRSTSSTARPFGCARATSRSRPTTTPTRSTPPSAGSTRAHGHCTLSTSTAREPAPRPTSRTSSGSPAHSTCRSRLVGGSASLESVRAVVDAGATSVILGTAAFRDPEFLSARVAEHGDRSSCPSTRAAGGRGCRLDRGDHDLRSRTRSATAATAVCGGLSSRASIATACSRDPTWTAHAPSPTPWRELHLLGGIGQLADLEALAGLREPNLTA